jgi:threonylcarbamoyladenosine tRNA methylthiotransferase MtaB
MVATFYVQNFGCRATQADGASIERQFQSHGLDRASTPADAQIVVLNTCTVTASADQDARASIRRIHRENPQARIVVTGCYAQRSPEELAALPGVAQVIGNSHKHQLAEIAVGENLTPLAATFPAQRAFVPLSTLSAAWGSSQRPIANDPRPIFVSDIFAHTQLLAAPVFDAANERTRPNLKVQDGCDNRCSFCVIPYVRGQSRSLPLERVLQEVNNLVAAGYRELVVSGINLGRWGRDLGPDDSFQESVIGSRNEDISKAAANEGHRTTANRRPPSFEDLIRAILDHTNLEKLRISSVEPMDWSDELIAMVAGSSRVAKHAHVPMQSGSDAVLRAMHRKYRPWHYREKIEKIHAAMPRAAIGADVMVGFPGETDIQFEETRGMIDELPLTYLHVFSYSARPGTPAAALPQQVPARVVRERSRILHELGERKKQAFLRGFLGEVVEAITLTRRLDTAHEGRAETISTEGLTDNYLKILLSGDLEPNQWVRARVDRVDDGVLLAGHGATGRRADRARI